MITKSQALTAQVFHAEPCTRHIGPRGGITEHVEVWRRSGKTQTWKTRPEEFRVPVKHGLYAYGSISDQTPGFHAAGDCPLLTTEGEVQ